MKTEEVRELFEEFQKARYEVPTARPLADFLPTLTIKAKDLATELTRHNVIDKNLEGETSISNEDVDNNLAVRNILAERGIKILRETILR